MNPRSDIKIGTRLLFEEHKNHPPNHLGSRKAITPPKKGRNAAPPSCPAPQASNASRPTRPRSPPKKETATKAPTQRKNGLHLDGVLVLPPRPFELGFETNNSSSSVWQKWIDLVRAEAVRPGALAVAHSQLRVLRPLAFCWAVAYTCMFV